jgi:hypothetical protein
MMSKIQFDQTNENEIEVTIAPETPMEMVEQLTKSLNAKGMIEDLSKSTLSVRYFVRKPAKAEDLADRLLKTLEDMSKSDELPYWHPKAQMANQKRVREMDIAERRTKNGVTPAGVAPVTSPAPGAGITPAAPPKMFDGGAAQSTAGGTGRRYATIGDINKEEDKHVDGCRCEECQMEKSGYGPKGAGQYTTADNVRRKMNNTGDVAPVGPNVNAKAISTKPGQLSGKQQATMAAKIQAKASKNQPVKRWSSEQIEAENKKRGLKKSWGEHLPFPSAEEEIMNFAKSNETQDGETVAATQLMNLMAGKNMLGEQLHPAIKTMFQAPPPQPTDQQMFGHLVVTEEMEKANQAKWQTGAFGWLEEATKPISQRFASEEEELAYWAKIKVADRDDREPGY